MTPGIRPYARCHYRDGCLGGADGQQAWANVASLSTSTRCHLDLRHGEGPLDLDWWLGHHAYPRLTGESSTASSWAAGMARRQRLLLVGQVRRKVHAGLRFGIPEDIYVPTEQLEEEEWWL